MRASTLSCLAFAMLVFPAVPAGATAFLAEKDIDASVLLPPPPANDSAREAAEIAELKAIAAHRTPDEWAQAAHDAKDETGDWFASAIGPGFDFAKLPATAQLLTDLYATEEVATKTPKALFHRDRPYVVIPGLETCTPIKPGPAATSYPSGHATVAFLMAGVLASLMPDKAQAILARARDYAEERLVCGMHFRSDIAAGQTLGTVVAVELMQNPAFRKEYDAAAAELSAAHLR
ncbi:MAG TPA: phosphatase PAP2 family protein [Rhizomicrobium sp.]|nr:phosphatase PAP2 family protein [Rhizomicrobium sp.]